MSLRARIYSLKGLFVGLHEDELTPDPIVQFGQWFNTARRVGCTLYESFTLSTVSAEGRPSGRLLLLKGYGPGGLVFYTNYHSRKSKELEANPHASMTFHWNQLFRQVRIEGEAVRLSAEESDAYFASRARGSQIGAWASEQSSVIESRKALEDRVKQVTEQYAGQDVPRPPHWGGYRLKPERFEFWQGRPSRLHDRLCYIRDGEMWRIQRLSP